MKNKISILRIITSVLIASVVIFIIVFPIVLRRILDERKSASIAKGYRIIEMIEKRNIQGTNKINDGKNISLKKIKGLPKKIDGEITIQEGKVMKVNLIIDGYKFNYEFNNDEKKDEKINEKEEILYYVDKDKKLLEPDSSWKVYIKNITEYKKNYKESEHILNYKYQNNKYSLILDNKKECKKITNKLSKIKGYSDFSCKIKYNMIIHYEQICNIFKDNEILCFDSNSWSKIKTLKNQIEEKNDVECNFNKERLYCYDENDLELNIKKDGKIFISRNIDDSKIICSLSKNKNANCLIKE